MLKKIWDVLWLTLCKYDQTDGEQRAASFAYYAFFSIFPLILLFVSIGSAFFDPATAQQRIIDFVGQYMPLDPKEQLVIIGTVERVVKTRTGVGTIALLGLAWSSLRFFQALVRGVNRAWGTHEINWWRLPIKNLFMVAILTSALLIGVVAPAIVDAVESYTWSHQITFAAGAIVMVLRTARWLLPPLILFYGFAMFYKFAPQRRTTLSEIWLAALGVAFALRGLQTLFVLYAKHFAEFDKLYGTLGGVVALLMWIYFSGSIIILGGCLSAAQAEIAAKVENESDARGD